MGDGHMDGYGQGGWMVLWSIGGLALLIVLVWFSLEEARR